MDQNKVMMFNTLLTDFQHFLVKTFPEEKTLDDYKMKISLANKVNPVLIYTHFKKFITPYNKQIVDCNEHFLLNELKELVPKDAHEFLDFSSIWDNPKNTVEIKARIFLFLRKLSKLTMG